MTDDDRTRSDLGVGDAAPPFERTGTSEQAGVVIERPRARDRLAEYAGRPVLLVLFSAACTPT